MALNPAQKEKLSKLSKEELLEFIDMFQKNWWNLQNNYILYINNEYGEEAAVKADAHCFPANAKVQMHRLRKMFGLTDDLQSLMDAMVLSTIWANADYDLSKVDEEKFMIKVTNCHQQVRRLEDGLGEIACKPAGIAICEAAAGVINPDARVRCLVCPPDEHPHDVWCEWEFEIPRSHD
ncbi:MAG: hypothetical protein JSV83_01045 [Desulfobacterales bacterium]|nr:MAG: hypothetical protein JSV83_01045 [Desulfobacterales bacterium]